MSKVCGVWLVGGSRQSVSWLDPAMQLFYILLSSMYDIDIYVTTSMCGAKTAESAQINCKTIAATCKEIERISCYDEIASYRGKGTTVQLFIELLALQVLQKALDIKLYYPDSNTWRGY